MKTAAIILTLALTCCLMFIPRLVQAQVPPPPEGTDGLSDRYHAEHYSPYAGWSFLCMLPGTILYVVGASAVTEAIAEGRIPWVLVTVLTVIIVIIAILTKIARRRIHDGGKPSDAERSQT